MTTTHLFTARERRAKAMTTHLFTARKGGLS